MAWTPPISVPNKLSLLTESYKIHYTYGLGLPLGRIFTQHYKKAGGRDSCPLVLEWSPWSMHGSLGGEGSPWSSWLALLKADLTFYNPAGVEVCEDPVFSAFYAWDRGSTVHVGARWWKGLSVLSIMSGWNRASATWSCGEWKISAAYVALDWQWETQLMSFYLE